MIAPYRFTASLLVFAVSLATLTGCSDDASTVREIQSQRHQQIQSQSRQDHLGEVFSLLNRLVELNPQRAQQQIAYHLNRWREGRGEQPASTAPEMLATIDDLVPTEDLAQRVQRETFVPSDVNHLRDCYLFGRIASWANDQQSDDPLIADWLAQQESELGVEKADQIRSAARLFDWTVRNIAIEPDQAAPPTETPVSLPFGMTFEGPGYRQTDFETVMRGTGDGWQRAGVFTQLCRQLSIPAFVLATQSSDTGELEPWSVGVLVGDQVYLFEPRLGTYIPGPGQEGIATLAQARGDATVMKRLDVQGFFDYPLDHKDVQQSTALLNVIPEAVSSRMKGLEGGLTGDRRMIVYADVDALGAQIDAASGVAGVRLWRVPLLAEVYRVSMEKMASRDPAFEFWYYSRWAILDFSIGASETLARGRWRHLHGQFDDDEVEDVKGARTLYLAQRSPEFEIAKLNIDVELQKQYGIRRQLGMDNKTYELQIARVQGIMRLGKRTATYWLSLLQYDDERYDTAENWFVKRALDEEQASFWVPAAKYNLARTAERLGETERAIELYKSDGVPQEHGNRIRARLIARTAR